MGASIKFASPVTEVVPGQKTHATAVVSNTGDVVEQFLVDVVGEHRDWIKVEPSTVNVLPDSSETVRLTFSPPESSSAPAGESRYGLRVLCSEDVEGSRVEEGVVQIAPFHRIDAELSPRTVDGKRRGRTLLAVDNLGNTATAVDVFVTDPDNQMRVSAAPRTVTIEPGRAALVTVRLVPRRRFLRGPHRTHPYDVTVNPESGDSVSAQGVMVQHPLLPRWALTGLIAVLALLIAAYILMRSLFNQQLVSAAQVGAPGGAELSSVRTEASAAAAAAEAAQKQADAAAAAAAKANANALDALAGGAGGAGTPASAGPTDFRLQLQTPAGQSKAVAYTVPNGRTLLVGDIMLQNPAGDLGAVQVKRGGTVLLESGLDTFRDRDFHFGQPFSVPSGTQVTLSVQCRNPDRACDTAAFFTGTLS